MEFPFPGKKTAKFSVSVSGDGTDYLGCHSKCLRNIGLGPISIRDPNLEIPKTEYGVFPERIYREIRKFVEEDRTARDALYRSFADKYRGSSLVVMSAPCNVGNTPDLTLARIGVYSTSGFAAWLKEQGEFIMGTPLITNPNHQTAQFSILRGWMWIPTSLNSARHIEGTEYISGKMESGLPFPEWWKYYQEFHNVSPLYRSRPLPDPHAGHLVPFEPGELMAS